MINKIALEIHDIYSICKDREHISQVFFLLAYKYNALFY